MQAANGLSFNVPFRFLWFALSKRAFSHHKHRQFRKKVLSLQMFFLSPLGFPKPMVCFGHRTDT